MDTLDCTDSDDVARILIRLRRTGGQFPLSLQKLSVLGRELFVFYDCGLLLKSCFERD